MIFPRGETFNFGSVLLTCCFNYDLTSLDFKPWFPPRVRTFSSWPCSGRTREDGLLSHIGRPGNVWMLWWHDLLSHRIHGTGIFTYICLICMVNVGKYTIHGWYGYCFTTICLPNLPAKPRVHIPHCSSARNWCRFEGFWVADAYPI